MKLRHAIAAAVALAAAGATAQDRADIDRTQVIGNRELPKVLYIVPWKKPPPGELSGKPVTACSTTCSRRSTATCSAATSATTSNSTPPSPRWPRPPRAESHH